MIRRRCHGSVQWIVGDLGRGKPQPIFDVDERSGDVLWELWLDGFAEAMELRPDSWAAFRPRGAAEGWQERALLLWLGQEVEAPLRVR